MERSLKDQAVIVGIGKTDFTKNSGVSEIALAAECVKNAIDDAGLQPSDIDGMTSSQAELQKVSQEVGKAMYEAAAQSAGSSSSPEGSAPDKEQANSEDASAGKGGDNVIDADYEVKN